MKTKYIKITNGAIEIDPNTEIDVDKEFIARYPISHTGITKVKTLTNDIEETYNMTACGGIELFDVKAQKEVKIKTKTSPSQLLRLSIERMAERKGIVNEDNINAYYEKVINNLITKFNNYE